MYYIYHQPTNPLKSPRLIALTHDFELAEAIVKKVKHLNLFVSKEEL